MRPTDSVVADTTGPQSLADADNVAMQRATWRFERAGWISLAILTLVALSGLLGAGPASHAVATSSDGAVAVGYERFARHGGRSRVEIRVARAPASAPNTPAPAGPSGGAAPTLRVWVDRAFLRDEPPQAITPPPSLVEHHGARLVYVFPVAAGAGPLPVTLELEPTRVGVARVAMGVEGGGSVEFRQFVYP